MKRGKVSHDDIANILHIFRRQWSIDIRHMKHLSASPGGSLCLSKVSSHLLQARQQMFLNYTKSQPPSSRSITNDAPRTLIIYVLESLSTDMRKLRKSCPPRSEEPRTCKLSQNSPDPIVYRTEDTSQASDLGRTQGRAFIRGYSGFAKGLVGKGEHSKMTVLGCHCIPLA